MEFKICLVCILLSFYNNIHSFGNIVNRNSLKYISSIIKKILRKIPADFLYHTVPLKWDAPHPNVRPFISRRMQVKPGIASAIKLAWMSALQLTLSPTVTVGPQLLVDFMHPALDGSSSSRGNCWFWELDCVLCAWKQVKLLIGSRCHHTCNSNVIEVCLWVDLQGESYPEHETIKETLGWLHNQTTLFACI